MYLSSVRVSFSNRPTGASTRGAEEESTKGVKPSAEGQSSPFRNKPTTQVSDSPPPYTSGAHYTSSPNNDGNIQGGSQLCWAPQKQFKAHVINQVQLTLTSWDWDLCIPHQGGVITVQKVTLKVEVRKNDQSLKEILQWMRLRQ